MTSTATPSDIVAAVESVVGGAPRPVALHEPLFSGNESRYVQSCLETGWVSSAGAFVSRLEKDLAAFCGAGHAVATVNGTCALHAALSVMGVGPGDEVLVPSLTFVATANAVSQAGAVPHFVEVEEVSLGIDPEALERHLARIASPQKGGIVNKESGRPIRAIVPVHVFGHPCRMEALQRIAERYGLILIEDATEALGSIAGGKSVGSGATAIFSFNGNKIITTGGGGAIVTQDEQLAHRLRHLTTTARQPHEWEIRHDAVAWNYRMPNLNAALGCAQLEQMPHFLGAKRALAERYRQAFAAVPGVKILPEPQETRSNYWLVTLMADKADLAWRNETLEALQGAQLHCRPLWTPLHLLPMYAACPRATLTLTEDLAARIISLPSSVALGLPYA